METFNNTTKVVKDDLEKTIKSGSRLSIAAACFSIYAYKELKAQLDSCEKLRFIFTSPTFVTEQIALHGERANPSATLSVDERIVLQEQFVKLERQIERRKPPHGKNNNRRSNLNYIHDCEITRNSWKN